MQDGSSMSAVYVVFDEAKILPIKNGMTYSDTRDEGPIKSP